MNTTPKAILLEANEIPFRVLDDYVRERPAGHLAAMMRKSKQLATVCEDQIELDPWISWPTLHRGVIDEQHGILHLGQSLDVPDRRYPPIWRILAAHGVKVGVMGSLHSSHIPDDVGDYAFYVPDFFANESFAHPPELTAFQQFNLVMTRMSARNVSGGLPLRPAAEFLKFYATHGVSRSTVTTTIRELLGERRHPHLRCRRRSIQPLLSLDVFVDLMRRTRPDFATLYTNHVAAAMHRYWAAAYPDDPDGSEMPAEWRALYRDEIRYAMNCLDAMVGRLMTVADDGGYRLLMCSSMGQAAHKSEPTAGFVTIVELERFMTAMGLSRSEWTERHAMVPCVSVDVAATKADEFERRLRSISCDGRSMARSQREVPPLSYDRSDDTFHLFVYFERYAGPDQAEKSGVPTSFADIGWGFHEHQDNIDCTGRHTPHGFLLVHESSSTVGATGARRSRISTLDIAPAILNYFDVPVPAYMNDADPAILDPAVDGTSVVVEAWGGGVERPVTRGTPP